MRLVKLFVCLLALMVWTPARSWGAEVSRPWGPMGEIEAAARKEGKVAIYAAPGHTLHELETAILEEIDRVASEGPTDIEIDRGRVQAESQFMFRLQTVGGFGGKSDQLNAYNVFIGDPDYFDRDLERYQTVTRASLRDATARYLDPARRVTLSIVPQGRAALAAPESALAVVA